MSEHDKIPLLEDLIVAGHHDDPLDQNRSLDHDDSHSLEISTGGNVTHKATSTESAGDGVKDDLKDDANLKELIIDEEIRMILDKHMDNAYDEIIRLLNKRIC